MFTKFDSLVTLMGSSPLKVVTGSRLTISRGAYLSATLAMAAIWAGEVPQHPPMMFSRPSFRNSSMISAIISGD